MSNRVVGLVDYRAGNLFSLENAFEHLGADVTRVRVPDDLQDVSHLVLPGVGAFRHCRDNLDASGLVPALQRWALDDRRPILGVCVGMQLMADCGWEFGRTEGLGWIPGEIRPLTAGPPDNRVPHVGWSEVRFRQPLPGLPVGASLDFYFDHSFAFAGVAADQVVASCEHAETFPAIVRRGNVLAAQCHPEKSQKAGLKLLEAFLLMETGSADG